jgi:hypothetical protein
MKQIDSPKTILHLKNKDYVYRYVLVDRFKNTSTIHYGFDKELERTEAEIFAKVTPRKLRRKYIIKD